MSDRGLEKASASNDFTIWVSAKAVLRFLGKLPRSECHGAGSTTVLLETMTQLDQNWFEKALNEVVLDEAARDGLRKHYYDAHPSLSPPPIDHQHKRSAAVHASGEITKTTMSIPRPANGRVYNKQELIEIMKQYPRGSKDRGRVRDAILEKGYVSSRTTLYRRMSKLKDIEAAPPARRYAPFISKGQAIHAGLGYEGDYIRYNIRNNVK